MYSVQTACDLSGWLQSGRAGLLWLTGLHRAIPSTGTMYMKTVIKLKVNVLRELQSATGEKLRPFFGRTLMAPVVDRAFKGEL
jgi:hypothetical protein